MGTFSALSLEMTKGQQHFILKWICFSPSFTRWGLKDSSQHEGSNTDVHREPTSCETPGTGSLIWGMALPLEGTGAISQIRKRRHRFLIRLKTRASKPKGLFPHFTLWSVCFRKLVHQAQLLWRTVWSVLKKKKTTESYHMIPQSHPWAYIQKIRQLCSPMATAALFTRVKIRKQPKCPSTDEWMRRCGVLLRHKKEWNNAICSNMGVPREYRTKWSKSDRERQIPYDII